MPTDYEQAADLAARHGLMLVRRSDHSYQLSLIARGLRQWTLGIHLGVGSIVPDARIPGPTLTLPEPWNLVDAVRAAIAEAKAGQLGLFVEDQT
jgi:hypothetical protein